MENDKNDVHADAYIHSLAAVEPGAIIGPGTRVWAWAHVLGGAIVGSECNICDHTYIEGGVLVGDRVTVKCGVYLWEGLVIEDDVFIGPSATFTNDLVPRSKQYREVWDKTYLSAGCSIGANSTILAGNRIGRYAMVAAGAVVTHDVPDFALVAHIPARIIGWVGHDGKRLFFDEKGFAVSEDGRKYHMIGSEVVCIS